jgi:sporulation protein YlmC with PRC-barrel domain
MKKAIQHTIWGAVAALSLGAFVATAGAQTESGSGASMSGANSLGKVARASKLVGKEVISADQKRIGKIENIVVDLESGHILYTVVNAAHGKVAVAPGVFREPAGNDVMAKVDKVKLDAAPQYTSDIDKPDQMGKAEYVSSVYQYFGQSPWWKGQSEANAGQFNSVQKVTELDGTKVVNGSDQTIGKVQDTGVQLPQGRVVYVILNPDSSLKLGDEYYALPPNTLTWNADQKHLVSSLTREQLAAAPHFAKDNWAALSSPAFASKVYQYYGKQAWFQPGGLQPTGR